MIGKYKGEDALYLADASNRASSVLLYGGCVGNTGKRKFIETVANPHKSSGVAHTYGLCTDTEGSVFSNAFFPTLFSFFATFKAIIKYCSS